MWIQFIDGWPRVVLMAVGLVAVVWLVITGRLYRRRRVVPPWPDSLVDAELRSGGPFVGESSSPGSLPPRAEPRVVRRLRALSTVIRLAGAALIVLMLVLLAWAALAFLSGLPGWS